MNWRALSPAKKGGFIGLIISPLGFVVSFVYVTKILLMNGWDEAIIATAGDNVGNVVGWIFIFGFMAVILSLMLAVPFALGLYALGALIGWVLLATCHVQASVYLPYHFFLFRELGTM